MAVRLNIGAGNSKIKGFTPIDRKFGTEAYPLADYADGSVDEIRASHILEHSSFDDVPKVLAEWMRVLKPGARIRIAVPDVDRVLSLASDPKRLHYLMGGQTDGNDFHKSAFDEKALRQCMADAGIAKVKRWKGDGEDCASLPVSLNLMGVKASNRAPAKKSKITVKIRAVMCIPRVGWNATWGCVIDALRPFNIPVYRSFGAYWDQGMQNSFEKCVDDGVDWILTIDYDSMFNAQHLDRLLGLLGGNPQIDAIAAMQCRRGQKFPLLTIEGKKKATIDGTPLQVTTAHFGLTLIRVDALKDVSKPWFHHRPDKNGSYGKDRLDADIIFWHQWKKAGKTVYIAPSVAIGHLELMLSTFDKNLKVKHVYVTDWLKQFHEGTTEGVG